MTNGPRNTCLRRKPREELKRGTFGVDKLAFEAVSILNLMFEDDIKLILNSPKKQIGEPIVNLLFKKLLYGLVKIYNVLLFYYKYPF